MHNMARSMAVVFVIITNLYKLDAWENILIVCRRRKTRFTLDQTQLLTDINQRTVRCYGNPFDRGDGFLRFHFLHVL